VADDRVGRSGQRTCVRCAPRLRPPVLAPDGPRPDLPSRPSAWPPSGSVVMPKLKLRYDG